MSKGNTLTRDFVFDQYGRYSIIKKIIDENRKPDQTFKILDVGGAGNSAKIFLAEDDVYFLDTTISGDKNYINGDGCNMKLDDNSFDWVISADVFEHIPRNKRENFLGENIRVAKIGVILAAPFFSININKAEIYANNAYRLMSGGDDHPWLKEHIENGLPDASSLENYLIKNKNIFYSIKHSNLNIWKRLIWLSFFVNKNKDHELFDAYLKLNEYYNANISSDDFNDEESYRTFYLIEKSGPLNMINKASQESVFYEMMLDEIFLSISKNNFLLRNINDNQERLVIERDLYIRKLLNK